MDLSLAVLAAVALSTAQPVTTPTEPPLGPRLPAARFGSAVALPPTRSAEPAPRDTVIEYSKAYYQRLTVHRWGSYAMLPLFTAQYLVGRQLYDGNVEGNEDLHGALALGVGGLFAVNTVTGLWNAWEMRADPNGRKRRITHVTLMLLADAGFVTTGVLGSEAEDGAGNASTHRNVAISSMAVSTIGWLIMTDLFRKD
jgi:hypothetical protein